MFTSKPIKWIRWELCNKKLESLNAKIGNGNHQEIWKEKIELLNESNNYESKPLVNQNLNFFKKLSSFERKSELDKIWTIESKPKLEIFTTAASSKIYEAKELLIIKRLRVKTNNISTKKCAIWEAREYMWQRWRFLYVSLVMTVDFNIVRLWLRI